MASLIKIKRSSIPGNVPEVTSLELGELAVNTYDGKLFFKKDDGTETIVTLTESGGGGGGGNGYTGSQGVQGYTGSAGADGSQGIQGIIGYTGSAGVDGSQGATGYTGSAGTSVVLKGSVDNISDLPSDAVNGDLYVVLADGDGYVRSGSDWDNVGRIQGPRGYTGSAGADGSDGAQGYTGSAGADGSDGGLGYTGSAGADGSDGAQGYTGSAGADGSDGAQGYTGSQGTQGNIGYTGSQGDQGYTGSQGDIGYTGSDGAQGYTGSAGAGYTGSAGADGSQGDIGYTGSAGVGYTGSAGATGSQGDIGYTGSAGADGVDGSDGAQGYTGSAGADGSQGDIGYTGSLGYTGSAGADGSDGAQGYTGSAGTGYTGSQGIQGYTGSGGGGTNTDYFGWTTSGSDNEYRTTNTFFDVTDDEEYTIRQVSLTGGQLRVELASFSPTLSASGQSRYWDQSASQFSVSVSNPDDFTTRYIESVSTIDNSTGVYTTVSDYSTTGTSVTPSGGVDWTQTFTTNSTATILSNGTGLTGGSATARITFADNDDTDFTGTRPTISYSWQNANNSIYFSSLTGKNFLEYYSSVNYTVSVTGISNSSNYTNAITATGGTLSSITNSGVLTFSTNLHKDNNSGRSVSLTTTFSRPSAVTGTAYNVDDTSSDSSISASFTYPSFYIWTANTSTPPTRSDIVSGFDFSTDVSELSNQTKTISTTINNSDSNPRVFWFGVRSSATQPTTFQTGPSSALLSDVSVTSGNTVNLEPDSPISGYSSEQYTLYGITLQPGNTYVSIN
jgi:hypothetical protein